MNIFQKIGKSVYGPDFYSGLKTSRTRDSVKYFLKLVTLLSLLSAIIWAVVFLPKFHNFLTPEIVKETVALYPADLNLKINKGEISTDAKLPYIIPFESDALKDQSNIVNAIKNFVVIDTRVDAFSLDLLSKNETMVFVGKNFVAGRDENGSFRLIPLSEYKDFSYELNRANIEALALKMLPTAKKALNFLPFLVLIGFFLMNLGFLTSALIMALVVWLVMVIKKDSSGYKYALRLTIHAATLAVIIDSILSASSLGSSWGLGTLILTIVIVLINTKKPKDKVEAGTPEATAPIV
jgi:hypothetical protein